jgi:hypothetical protein
LDTDRFTNDPQGNNCFFAMFYPPPGLPCVDSVKADSSTRPKPDRQIQSKSGLVFDYNSGASMALVLWKKSDKKGFFGVKMGFLYDLYNRFYRV